MEKKLKTLITEYAVAALITGGLAFGCAHLTEKHEVAVIEKGVLKFCGDTAHAHKVIDYYHRQKKWHDEPLSPKQLIKRHKDICPGKGIDY